MSMIYPFFGIFFFMTWSLHFWGVKRKSTLIYKFVGGKSRSFLIKKLLVFLAGVAGIGFIIYSLTFPRIPLSKAPNSREVNDIYLIVDVSRSMLADDIKPNRLEAAKEKLKEFAALMPTDRIGLIMFSEKVFTLLPLTTDPQLINNFMDEIKIGFLGSGTNIGDALGLGVARAQASETKNKIIILLTDGVSNVGNMTPLNAAEQAKKYKIKVYTIGLGSDKNARIPIGSSVFGTRFQKIPGGSIDMETLKKISELTGAKSFRAKDKGSLKNILTEIERLEKTKVKVSEKVIYKELYWGYLALGILLFYLSELLKYLLLREVA